MTATQAWDEFRKAKSGEVIDWNRFEAGWKHYAGLHGKQVAAITSDDIDRITRKQTVSKSTLRRDLACVQAWLKWCVRKKYMAALPLVDRPPESAPRTCWMTQGDIAKVMGQVDRFPEWLGQAVRLLFLTGQRLDAVLGLRWEQVDVNAMVVDFNLGLSMAHRRKRRAALPITEGMQTLLEAAWGNQTGPFVIHVERGWGSVPAQKFRQEWKLLCKAAGVAYITPHGIRHSVATNLVRNGVPLQEVSQFLGHSSIATTEKSYLKRSPEFMKRAGSVMGEIVG